MKIIKLSAVRGSVNLGKYESIIDNEDYKWVSQFNWHALVQGNGDNTRVYAVASLTLNGKPTEIRMHREVWQRVNGPIAHNKEIDHKNPGKYGGLDNRRANLRIATKAENQANCRKQNNNTSGYKGVHFYKRWRSQITVGGKQRHLGYFDNPIDAARAYDIAARRYFGQFARLNFQGRDDGRTGL